MSKDHQAVRSGGYHVLHSFLCVIGTLIVIFCMSNTAALRYYTASNALTDSLRAARLSDAAVPFTGKNLSEYIRANYVDDERVLTEDVAAAADGMGIPSFLADKLDQHFALLRGTSDTPMEISGDELTGQLDQIAESLHESAQLIIEDSDKQQIRDAVSPVLNKVNAVSTTLGGSRAGRAFQRFGISIWAYVLEVILLGLLAWRWCVIRKNSGKDAAGAFKRMGWTVMVPAAIGLLLAIIGAVGAFFAKDSVTGLNDVTKTLRTPYWYITITGVTFAVFMMELCAFIRWRVTAPAKPKTENSKASVFKKSAAVCVNCGKKLDSQSKFCKYCGAKQEEPAPAPASAEKSAPASAPAPATAAEKPAAASLASAPAASPAPAPAAASGDTRTCVCCGKEITAKMKFCKFCGTNQETGENIVDAVLNGTAGMPEAPEDDSKS